MMRFTKGTCLMETWKPLCTVNTVGVMGKGIALMFKERFPKNYEAYAAACKAGDVQISRMFVSPVDELDGPRWVINFPTKEHWRPPTKLEWVRGVGGAEGCHSGEAIADAVAHLGKPDEIGKVFVDFQKFLYQQAA